jgi:cellulose biosynthesis protein BcsQ
MTMTCDLLSPSGQNDLARFVLKHYRDDDLSQILINARDELFALTGSRLFDGYASGRASQVHNQVRALYNALFKSKPVIECTEQPENWLSHPLKQFVRTPAEILDQLQADSLDVITLMACLLIEIGLNPVIVTVASQDARTPTHAVLGYWLEDKTLANVTGQLPSLEPHLERLAFLESTGCLEGARKPFPQALAVGLLSIPGDLRSRAYEALPPDAREQATELLREREDIRTVCVIDVKRMQLDVSGRIPVIALMGAKGGVGKTTITARMAELIAETGNNVLVIDFDIESAGSTVFHYQRVKRGQPSVKTVYDHLVPYSASPDTLSSLIDTLPTDERLWEVTPDYLAAKGLGSIYLLPARPLQFTTGRWEAVADIKAEERTTILLRELNKMLQRTEMAGKNINCIIVDCGAEFNPLVSAAFYRANYGFIVAMPDVISMGNVAEIRREHQARYPKTDVRKIQVIVNRALSEADRARWASVRPAGFIPDAPDLYEAWLDGSLEFDLGYDDFSRAIQQILVGTLQGADSTLVPDEAGIWVAPWMQQIVELGLPERRLPVIKRKSFFAAMLAVIAAALMLLSAYLYVRPTAIGQLPREQLRVAVIQTDSAKQAEELLIKIQDGSDFAALAGIHSTDADTREKGGLIQDPVSVSDELPGIGTLVGLENCLAKLEIGSVCQNIFSSGDSYYVVKVVEGATEDEINPIRSLAAMGFLLMTTATAAAAFKAWGERQRRKLLQSVAERGADKEFLMSLLRQPKKGALKWLNKVFEEAIATYRREEYKRRMELRQGDQQ